MTNGASILYISGTKQGDKNPFRLFFDMMRSDIKRFSCFDTIFSHIINIKNLLQ